MIMQVIQRFYYEILIVGRRTVFTDFFLKWLLSGRMCKNIPLNLLDCCMKWFQTKHLSVKSCLDKTSEIGSCTVSVYVTSYLSIK